MKKIIFLLIYLFTHAANAQDYSIARAWNEEVLHAIRNDFARPTVHARNLFHTSIAMYDIWAVFDENADTFFLGKSLGEFNCAFDGFYNDVLVEENRKKAISYAIYRIVQHRFSNSPGVDDIYNSINSFMDELGYNKYDESTDYHSGDAAALGNYVAQQIIEFGLQDNSNEQNDYANLVYEPLNEPLNTDEEGNPNLTEPNHWQPLTMEEFIDQSGNYHPGGSPEFLSPEWGKVIPFSLKEEDLSIHSTPDYDYWVYHDPNSPSYIQEGIGLEDPFKWGFTLVSIWGSHLDPNDDVMIDISPASIGNISSFPETFEEAQKLIELFRPFFEATHIEKIGQNLKYDLKVLHKYKIEVKGPLFDTMIAHYLINADMRHNMDVLAETYLNYTPISITELIGKKGKNQLSMRDVSLEKLTEYAVEDADITYQLASHFKKELTDADTLKLFNEIEIPLVKVLASMELEGIKLDTEFLNSLSEDLNTDISTLESKIYEAAGEQFNIASPKQLGIILFEKLKLVDKPKKTKTGQYSTAEDVLSYLAKDHEIIQNVLDYRGLAKLKSTYVDALPEQVLESTGHIHTEYMQTVAATGRLSSNNPNLQNIPIRTERGRQVRKAFVPRNEEYILLAADYSQIELRVIAAMSEEETMIEAFKNGEDIHASTAAKVFNVPLAEVTREQRGNAKTVNFGIIYGVSAFGLSNQTDLSRTEAKELIETYYETYPKLRKYMSSQVDFARDHGYVTTVSNRRRYLKDINSRNAIVRGAAERNAVNAPIQGSAADIIKIAMINIYNKLEEGGFKTKMLLQVHDELVFDVYKPELDAMKTLIQNEMENAYTLSVPLDVEMDMGVNWLEAH